MGVTRVTEVDRVTMVTYLPSEYPRSLVGIELDGLRWFRWVL